MKTTAAQPCYLHAPGDLPALELMALAESLIANGERREIHFQFNCQWCGQRNTLAAADKLYEFGACFVCGQETEILFGVVPAPPGESPPQTRRGQSMKTKAETDSEIYQLHLAANDVCALARQGDKYALRTLARVTVLLTQCMDELLETGSPARKTAVDCWRPIFAGLPSLPVLKHRHDGDGRQIQARLELLRVGSELDFAKAGAKYHPGTPINDYVSELLVHLHEVRNYIDSRLKCRFRAGRDRTPEKALARCTQDQRGVGWIAQAEIPIHLAAYEMPPLAKSAVSTGNQSLADKWARDVFIPLIRVRESSLENFARRMGWRIRRGRVESDVRNKVAQSLETLAANSTKMPAS